MPALRHAYFAYGSNLCVGQMARRCPDAGDPHPATLTGHGWLINERGVATIEPLAGNRVHGVLWSVSESDLAALDSAEGVPVRYRRDQLTVHTHHAALPAWVYIDHRVNPGIPRLGYLKRVVDGAIEHGLPDTWIDFLRRWDSPSAATPDGGDPLRPAYAALAIAATRTPRRGPAARPFPRSTSPARRRG